MDEIHLVPDIVSKSLKREPMKKGYGRGLVEAGKKYPNIVALSSDVVGSTGTDAFAQEFPDRFIEVGIAEQNLVATASGLAAMGKLPFAAAYGAFSPGRNWEQIKTTICINDQPVKLVATHVGLSDAPDGATHQMLEDIALMRVLSNMSVFAPCDSIEAAKITFALGSYNKPAYIRIARDDTSIITTEDTPFEIGTAYIYKPGTDVSIISTGRMTYFALVAAEMLAKDKINAEVIHVPTIKPLDSQTILESLKKTKAGVTAEEAQAAGGFGAAITELASENFPVPIKRVGVNDRFGESGDPDQLFTHLGLDAQHIVLAAHHVIGMK